VEKSIMRIAYKIQSSPFKQSVVEEVTSLSKKMQQNNKVKIVDGMGWDVRGWGSKKY
jgi:hypothetical protein